MRQPLRRLTPLVLLLAALVLVTGSFSARAAGSQSGQGSPAFPGRDWERIEKPESIGYSSARLQALRAWLQSIDTTGLMVAVGGRSLFEYGDLTRLSYLASVRKSLLAMLYGKYVENGTIPLGKTLRDMEFTDVGGLMPQELEATIEDLITAFSTREN